VPEARCLRELMPDVPEIMPNSAEKPNPTPLVVGLVYDGLCTFEYGIAAEVFGLQRPDLDHELYRFTSVSINEEWLTAHGGLEIKASGTVTDLEKAHTIVVPGWRGKDEPVPEPLCQHLRTAYASGARILAICSGCYVLAAAGLLTNRRATTHWQYLQHFQSRYPEIDVQDNKLYIDDEGIITSAGSSAGLDACLHVVRCDYGVKVANAVAQRLVMHSHRHGAHAQLIERPVAEINERHGIAELITSLRANLSDQYHIASLAERVDMSPRSFQRHFLSFTGIPVMQWLVQERLTMMCELLESSDWSVETISNKVGFTSTETMRYHFKHMLQSSPSEYRKTLNLLTRPTNRD